MDPHRESASASLVGKDAELGRVLVADLFRGGLGLVCAALGVSLLAQSEASDEGGQHCGRSKCAPSWPRRLGPEADRS